MEQLQEKELDYAADMAQHIWTYVEKVRLRIGPGTSIEDAVKTIRSNKSHPTIVRWALEERL